MEGEPLRVVTLLRVRENKWGTFGVLIDEEESEQLPICLTLERRWLNNQTNLSSIPLGEYACVRHESPTFGETFLIKIESRPNILFHWGNFQENSLGCVILAEKYDKVFNKKSGLFEWGVAESKDAFNEFMARLNGKDSFKLLVLKA